MKTFEQFKNWWETEQDVEEKSFLSTSQDIVAGKRIRLIQADEYYDEHPLFKPGIEGTIINTEEIETGSLYDPTYTIIHVLWDNGSKVVLVVDVDEYEIIN